MAKSREMTEWDPTKEIDKQKAHHREGERQFCVLAPGQISGAALAAEGW